MSDVRSRNYALITYHSEEVIQEVLKTYSSRIRHYAYILHDKDTKDDGSPQVVHHHVLIQFGNAMTLSAVRKLFPIGQNTLGEAMRDKSDCFRYLDHADLPDKFHYDHSLIKSDDIKYWESTQSGEQDEKTLSIVEDILARIPLRELARRYGRDIVVNYSRYREFALMLRREESGDLSPLPAGMTVEEIPKFDKPAQIAMDDIIFDGADGRRAVIDKETGEMKDYI